tara:strand:- start:1227 stop:1481 length:255 start_codon:yes stop_codon:yes gene_type:complete
MNLSHFSSSTLGINLKEFKEYVYSFYGSGGIEDIGASKEQIEKATLKVIEYSLESGESDIHGAFSSDLKLIKEILIRDFGLKEQ